MRTEKNMIKKMLKKIIIMTFGFMLLLSFEGQYHSLADEYEITENEMIVNESDPYIYIGESKSQYIRLNKETFPDDTLRNYLDQTYGETYENGERIAWVLNIMSIDLIGDGSNTYGTKDDSFDYSDKTKLVRALKGIEYLTNLSEINVRVENIPDISFENNKNISWITLIGNGVGTIDVSKNNQLTTLVVLSDHADVKLGDNPSLGRLVIDSDIKSIDLSGCSSLYSLVLEHTGLSSVDLGGCDYLTTLAIERSELSSLDVSKCERLEQLNVSYNQNLSELKPGSGIKKLWMQDTKIGMLDISSCTSLCFLDTAFSPLKVINTKNTALPDGCIVIDKDQKVESETEVRHLIISVRGDKSGTIDMKHIPSYDLSYITSGAGIDKLPYDFNSLNEFYNSENGRGGGSVLMINHFTTEDGEIIESNSYFSDIYDSNGSLTRIDTPETVSFYDDSKGEIINWFDKNFHYISVVYDTSYDTVIYNGEKYYIRNNMQGQFWAEPLSEYYYCEWWSIDKSGLVFDDLWIGPLAIGNLYLEQLANDFDNGAPKAFLLNKNHSGQYDMTEIYYDVLKEENGWIEYDYENKHERRCGELPAEPIDTYVNAFSKYASKPSDKIGNKFASYQGYDFYIDDAGNTRCYDGTGNPVINEFKCDGTYTYYFQADGTAMKDRLTYHPDGEHVIYFDSEGHEVFSDFANVRKTIAGDEVNDFCFFDVFGYMYVDVLTYDKTGSVLYYANPYGVMEMGKWFQFSDTVEWADGTPAEGIAGGYGYANADGTLMTNTQTVDWEGRSCYLQGNGVALY